MCGCETAPLMIMFPSECPTKEMRLGLRLYASMWYRISDTSRSVRVSKFEKVSPWEVTQRK